MRMACLPPIAAIGWHRPGLLSAQGAFPPFPPIHLAPFEINAYLRNQLCPSQGSFLAVNEATQGKHMAHTVPALWLARETCLLSRPAETLHCHSNCYEQVAVPVSCATDSESQVPPQSLAERGARPGVVLWAVPVPSPSTQALPAHCFPEPSPCQGHVFQQIYKQSLRVAARSPTCPTSQWESDRSLLTSSACTPLSAARRQWMLPAPDTWSVCTEQQGNCS